MCVIAALHLAALVWGSLVPASGDRLFDAAAKEAFRETMALSTLGRHDAAETAARTWPGTASPAGRILVAVAGLSRFADLHDPAALDRARAALSDATDRLEGRSSPRERFLLSLAYSQQSYLASLEGRQLGSALAGRKAANLCLALRSEGFDTPDLKGILGGYFFWKAQSLGALRFALGGDTRTKGLEWSIEAAASPGPFQEAYRTSLLWIRFERKEFDQGLALARAGLAACPGNRLYRQAEGDMLFRLNRFHEALEVYRVSWNEYTGLETIPANRLAAAGNLARIHLALQRPDSANAWLDTLDAPRYANVRAWLPPSLVRELAPVRRRLARD
jgi:hypothetical protein